MAKITVVIDDELLKAPMKATGLDSVSSLIERGLRELVSQANQEALRAELGTFDIEISPEELRQSRAAR